MKESLQKRDSWNSKLGFILATAGSAVGLGNLWKFPYTVGKNGGGAFLLVYMIFLLLIGYPLMLAAITLGRKTKLCAVGAYKSINKNWAFVGFLGVLCGFFILAFYSTVGGWVIYYLIEAIKGNLNTTNSTLLANIFTQFISSPQKSILYQAIFLIITYLIVVKGIKNGIEKASKIMMPALLIMIIIIAFRSLSLPNAIEGIKFLFIPDFSKVNLNVIMNALGQVFFSLSIGMGVIVTYGSYLDKKENIILASTYIPLLDTFVALVAGLATIPAVFSFNFEIAQGPSLMFITLPAVFSSMSFGYLFCIAFFILVLFAALTSSISMLEVCVSYFVDEKNKKRSSSALLITLVIFLIGIPATLSMGVLKDFKLLGSLNFFDFYDKLTSNIFLPLGGFLLSIFVGYVLTTKLALDEICINGEKFILASIWSFLIKYIVPPLVFIILINSLKELFTLIIN